MENASFDLTGIRLTYSSNSSEETGLFEKGTLLKGKCMDGYVMKGKNQEHVRPLRKKCRRNGEWVGRGDDMKCELITCPPLKETGYLSEDVIAPIEKCSGGVRELLDGSGRMSVKSRCRFSCKDTVRYKMIGSKIARCNKNSEWKLKGGRPKCTLRHKYKKKEKKEKRKKKHKKKKKPKVKGNEKSHNGRHHDGNEILTTETTYDHKVSIFYFHLGKS